MRFLRATALAVVAVGASAFALTGCTSNSAPADAGAGEPVTLSFLTYTSPNVTKEFWEEAASTIEADNPGLTIELLYTPTLDRQGYARQLLASGQLPDIMWDAPLQEFVDAGALLPFEPSDYEGINVPEGYGAIDGKQYSLFNGSFIYPGVYYNPDAFAAAGVEVPTTFDQLVTAAQKLKDKGTTPFLLSSGSDTWSTQFILNSLISANVLGNDPDWMAKRKAGDVSFSDPEFRKSVDAFVELRDAGYFNTDALSINYTQANAAWATGDYAMWPMGGWAAAVTSDAFTPGVFAMPTFDGAKVLPVTSGAALYVSAATAHPDLARKVAVELVKNTKLQSDLMVNDAQFPIISGVEAPEGTAQATLDGLALYENPDYTQVSGFPNVVSNDDLPPVGWPAEYEKAVQALLAGGSTDQFVTAIDDAWNSLNK